MLLCPPGHEISITWIENLMQSIQIRRNVKSEGTYENRKENLTRI